MKILIGRLFWTNKLIIISKKKNNQNIPTKIRSIIGIMSRVFANCLGDPGSIPHRVIPKTQKMVLDNSLFNTQHYKVRIKDKVEQSRERSSALPYTSL